MKKLYFSCIVAFCLCLSLGSVTHAHMDCDGINSDVELSDAQKQELQGITEVIFANKKEMINLYVEFGVLTEEKGEKMLKKMEKHHLKLKENGYVPKWEKYCKDKDKAKYREWR